MKSRDLLWLIGLALLAFSGGYTVTRIAMNGPRGIRNNNPGNIEKGPRWKGLAPQQPDSRFATFIAPEWGIRAMAVLLTNYQRLHGLDTIAKIINRWAPPSENNSGAYVNAVARAVGIDPNARINVADILPRLLPAIIKHENGMQPYGADIIAKAIQLARE